MLANIDNISGAKRKENLTEHAENARISKVLATAQSDMPVDLDLGQDLARTPDRGRLREFFREFELRDPLRRLEEALGDDAAAPAPEAERTVSAAVREATLADVRQAAADAELALVVKAPETPEGELVPLDDRWRFAAATPTARSSSATATGPASSSRRSASAR